MTTPLESRISATDRLRQEGRWDEASRFRDDQRMKLKEAGMRGVTSSRISARFASIGSVMIRNFCCRLLILMAVSVVPNTS